jgi:hypothetical protein
MSAQRGRPWRGAPVVLLLLVLGTITALWSPSAGAAPRFAQESPPTTAAGGPSASTTIPTTTTTAPKATPANRLVPGGQYGDFPLDAYDYMYSTNEDGKDDIFGVNIPGVNLDLPVPTSQEQGRRTVTGMIASWAFAATVTIVKLALLIVGWAFNFPLLGLLGDLVSDTVNRLEGEFIGPAGIRTGVAVLAAFIAGWYLLTARLVHGLREALIGVVMIALAGMVVSNVDRYYQAASEFGAGMSSVIVGLAGNSDETGVDAVQSGMAQALVAEPWALLNFGTPLEGPCAVAGREILATGPHGTDAAPRKIMRDAGCTTEAAFNQNPTTERAIDAGLLFLGVLPAALFMVLVAFTLLIAQFRLAIAFVLAPGALLLGAVASTRHLAGRWALFAVKALLGILAPVVVLSAMALIDLLILTGIDFEVTVGGVRIDLIAKLVLINAANLALWMKRRVIADGIYRATTVKADRALVKAGVPTAAPETPKPLAARLDRQTVMPGVRDPVAAAAGRTRTAVGGARAGTAKLATTAAGVAAGPAARGSAAAAAVLGVAQKTAVATGGNTTDADGRRTGTATGGASRGGAVPVLTPAAAGNGRSPAASIGSSAPPAVVPSTAFATAAASRAAVNGHGPGGSGPAANGSALAGGVALAGGNANGGHLGNGPGSRLGNLFTGDMSTPAANGGLPGPPAPAAAPPPAAPAGPPDGVARQGISFAGGQPATGGPFAGFEAAAAPVANGNGNGTNGHGGDGGLLLDLTAVEGSANHAGTAPPAASSVPASWPIPPAPPVPSEPVTARRVASTVPADVVVSSPIRPIPPPPAPPGPSGGDEG